VRIVARAPGKLVALGEYAVLDGAPALVLAVDRYCDAAIGPSGDDRCRLVTRMPNPHTHVFGVGAAAGVALVDLVSRDQAAPAWNGVLDSQAFFSGAVKLGLGSSAAALCAWTGAWEAYGRRSGARQSGHTLETLIELHRRFQGGSGSGLDVAASLIGGAIDFRLGDGSVPHIGSVRLPNSVGFAGIFAGRSASTPVLLARYRAFRADSPARAAQVQHSLQSIAEAGCAAAAEDDADAFMQAITDYGLGLQDLGVAIGADIVTAEHRRIGALAKRYGVAYKVSGAGGGDLGIAFAVDLQALDAFKKSVSSHEFSVVDFRLAGRGLVVEEHME
jgi:phosphomevalonate kinase